MWHLILYLVHCRIGKSYALFEFIKIISFLFPSKTFNSFNALQKLVWRYRIVVNFVLWASPKESVGAPDQMTVSHHSKPEGWHPSPLSPSSSSLFCILCIKWLYLRHNYNIVLSQLLHNSLEEQYTLLQFIISLKFSYVCMTRTTYFTIHHFQVILIWG